MARDLTGQKFGRLTVLGRAEDRYSATNRKYIMWRCKCDCGNEVIEYANHLRNGVNISCGCLRRDNMRKLNKNYNAYEIYNDYVKMFTTKGEPFFIDTDDLDKVKDICWSKNQGGYLGGWDGTNQVLLHRFITNCPSNMVVDHLNKDITDNRKANLRVTNGSYNNMNRDVTRYNTSGHIGVCWNNKQQRWIAQIGYNNQTIYIGCYKNIQDAIRAREEKEKELYSETILNAPQCISDVLVKEEDSNE